MSFRDYEDYVQRMNYQEEQVDRLIEKERKAQQKFWIVVAIIVLLIIVTHLPAKKKYVTISSLDNLPSPIQIDTTGETMVKVKGIPVQIHFLATYQVVGKVVDAQKYYDFNTVNRLGPVDVGLAWGFMARDSEQLKFQSAGNRFLSFHTSDVTWYNSHGREQGIAPYWSNNHLIPANSHIENLIRQIKKDDYIQIQGYLINASWSERGSRNYWWNSSISRTDTGDGACEIIYVTDVAWLKEE